MQQLRVSSEDLARYLRDKEKLKLEFKFKYELEGQAKQKQFDEVAKDIISLFNTAGRHAHDYAHLIIGAGDELLSDGTRKYEVVQLGQFHERQFLNIVNSRCAPQVPSIDYQEVIFEGRLYGVIALPPSPHVHELTCDLVTPKGLWRKGSVLLRSGEGVIVANPQQITQMQRQKGWMPMPGPVAQSHGAPLKQTARAALRDGLVAEFCFKRNQMIAHVYDEYSLHLDAVVRTAFDRLNAQRTSRGLKSHFSSMRFRLIRGPRFADNGIELDLAPIDFVYRVMLEDKSVDEGVKEHIRIRIEENAQRIPKWLQGTHPSLSALNYHPLGVEIAIVTKDGRTLLRKRGASVLLATLEWDVSYSGYCGEKDMPRPRELDVALTAQHELHREIGSLAVDRRDIVFTGIHRNADSGAVDVLGFWPTEARSDELVDLLTDKYPDIRGAFETKRRAEEDFVWDTTNLVVDFDGLAISRAIKKLSEEQGKPASLIPEAFVCLLRALEVTGNSTAELAALAPS